MNSTFFLTVFYVVTFVVGCHGRAALVFPVTTETPILQVEAPDLQEDTLSTLVAEQLLSALNDPLSGRSSYSSVNDPVSLAGDSLRIGLFGLMGYHGKDNCMQRCACEAGYLLGQMSDTTQLALTALQYMTPPRWNDLVDVVKMGSYGISCAEYRCGHQELTFVELN